MNRRVQRAAGIHHGVRRAAQTQQNTNRRLIACRQTSMTSRKGHEKATQRACPMESRKTEVFVFVIQWRIRAETRFLSVSAAEDDVTVKDDVTVLGELLSELGLPNGVIPVEQGHHNVVVVVGFFGCAEWLA